MRASSYPMQASVRMAADTTAFGQTEGFVAAFVEKHSIGSADRARISLVIEELLTNLIKFGYPGRTEPGRVEITLRLEGKRLTLLFADDGVPFNPLAHPLPKLDQPAAARLIGGLGIHIMRALADELSYHRSQDRNLLRFTRTIATTDSP